MFRICPRFFFSSANAARQTLNVPFRSMSTTVPKPFGESSSAAHRKFPAAPLTTMSILPNRSIVAAIAFSTSSGFLTSATTAKALPKLSLVISEPSLTVGLLTLVRVRASLIAFAAGSRCSRLRLTSATFAPASANARATPPVIPVPPPVTNATRPLRIPSAKIVFVIKVTRTQQSCFVCARAMKLGARTSRPQSAAGAQKLLDRRIFALRAQCGRDVRAPRLPAGNKWSRLDYINLAFHIGPFDVLITVAENPLNVRGGGCQTTNYFIAQNDPLAADRNFFDPAMFVKCQQTVFFRARQDLHRVGSRAIDDLLSNSLPFHDLHPQTALGADVDRRFFVFTIEWICGDHDAGAFRVNPFLNQNCHENFGVLNTG